MDKIAGQAQQTERFVYLLTGSQRDILRYILAMVPDVEDAQEILQDTAIALWQRFDRYDPDQPFTPWACRFAFRHVLKYRQRRVRQRKYLSVEALQLVAKQRAESDEVLEARRRALRICVEKLNEAERELIDRRYLQRGLNVATLAESTGQSAWAVYKALERIRRRLLQCVNRTVQVEGLV